MPAEAEQDIDDMLDGLPDLGGRDGLPRANPIIPNFDPGIRIGIYAVIKDTDALPGEISDLPMFGYAQNRCKQAQNRADNEYCQMYRAMSAASATALAANKAYPACPQSARLMAPVSNPTLEQAVTPSFMAVAAQFERHCMAAINARTDDPYPGAAPPPVLATQAHVDRAMDALALVVVGGRSVCTGLMVGGTFVTARHCRTEILAGNPVRQVSTGEVLTLTLPPDPPPYVRGYVPGDWDVYTVAKSATLRPPPAISFVNIQRYEAVTVMAGFPHLAAPLLPNGSLRDAIRYPRPGMCLAIDATPPPQRHCLQLSCQTMPGFSGAPILRSAPQGEGIEVIGFISGSSSDNSDCGPSILPDVTTAVPSGQVKGVF